MQQKAIPMGAITPTGQAGEWRLRSVGYNLGAAILIGVIVIVGTLFETIQTLAHPSRWPELLRRGHTPKLALHEWDLVDGDTKDIS